jgi:hypothetical protein
MHTYLEVEGLAEVGLEALRAISGASTQAWHCRRQQTNQPFVVPLYQILLGGDGDGGDGG